MRTVKHTRNPYLPEPLVPLHVARSRRVCVLGTSESGFVSGVLSGTHVLQSIVEIGVQTLVVPFAMPKFRYFHRILRACGRVFGPVPGWYMLLVEPFALNGNDQEMTINTRGVTMKIDFQDFVQRKYFFRSYERRELRFVAKHLRAGDVGIDVGANVGVLAMHMAHAVGPTGRVLAVEPIPQNLERLATNMALNSGLKVDVVASAASSIAGVLTLGRTPEQVDRQNHGAFTASEAGEFHVAAQTLDQIVLAATGDERRIRLLKIDVEGMEGDVLQGGRQLFEQRRVEAVLFEMNLSVPGEQRAAEILAEHGFNIFVLGMGARLRPLSESLLARRPSTHRHGQSSNALGSIIRWIKGESRLYTLVATLDSN